MIVLSPRTYHYFQHAGIIPMASYTVPELSEMAIDKLPRFVQGIARRKLARREKKLELTAHLCSEFESVERQVSSAVASNNSVDLLAVPVSIDPENLQAILDAIIKFLTDIAPLIKIFIDLLMVLLIVFTLSASASAQTVWWGDGFGGQRDGWFNGPVCTNGKCDMCWGADGIVARQAAVRQKQMLVSTTIRETPNRTVTRYREVVRQEPRTRRVKQCVNGQCFWTTETYFVNVTVRVPIEEAPVATGNPQASTPTEAVLALMSVMRPSKGDVIHDFGCGDGRVLTAAAMYGARTVGIEIDDNLVEEANKSITMYGLNRLAKVYKQDLTAHTKETLKDCNTVFMYLPLDLMQTMVSKLPDGCKVWSYSHQIPGAKKHVVGDYVFYEWIKA